MFRIGRHRCTRIHQIMLPRLIVCSVGFSLLLDLSPAIAAAAYTAGELELLEAFSRKGFEERDVAGLLHAEAEDELARPIDRHSFDALRKKIWRTSVRRRSTLPQLLPSAPLQPPAAPQLCSAVALRPTGPPRVSLARVPYSKHANVAAALVEAVLHPAFSKLAADDLVTPSQRRMEYVTALAESLLLRFQPGTVAAVLRTWNRYVQWHLDQHLELTFRDVTVKKFLLAQEARGRTVPAAVFQHLKWLREELQVLVPLESPLLKPFASPHKHMASAGAATAAAVVGAPAPVEFHRAPFKRGSPSSRFRGAFCSVWLTIQALLKGYFGTGDVRLAHICLESVRWQGWFALCCESANLRRHCQRLASPTSRSCSAHHWCKRALSAGHVLRAAWWSCHSVSLCFL